MQKAWGELTRNRTIIRIEILDERRSGEGAEVGFRVHFKDGSTKEDIESFIKQEGEGEEEERWKLFVR